MKVLFHSLPRQTLFAPSARRSQTQAAAFPGNVQDAVNIQFAGRIKPNLAEKQAQQFIAKHRKEIQKLSLASGEMSWASTCQGADYIGPGQTMTNQEREAEADNAYKDYFNNPQALVEVTALLSKKDKITNRLLVRQLEDLYEGFKDAGKTTELLELEKKLIERVSELTGIYNNYRGQVDGTIISNSQIAQRLQQTDDPVEAKKLWLASSGHGAIKVGNDGLTLAQALADLVKDRNTVARLNMDKNGKSYSDYYSMRLDQSDINENMLVELLEKMDEATRQPFEAYTRQFNLLSQQRYGISAEEARFPWYGAGNLKRMLQFDLQPYFQGKDPLVLLEKTAQLMGDTLQGIFSRSVYDKNGETRSSIYFDPAKDDGKSQHWFSFGINPPDDVRTFGSVDPNHQNMMDYAIETLLHESTGHGLDGTNISKRVPQMLRGHHSITTESHAMLLENLLTDVRWLEKVVGLPKSEAEEVARKAKTYNQAGTLGQIRGMVMNIQFERQMYKNPDQDLNKLWWDLQEKYLGVKRPPEGDLPTYARIPHFFSHPVYYQNYFLADLARAQKLAYINENFQDGLLSKEAGDYLRTYRSKGDSYDWDDLIVRIIEENGEQVFEAIEDEDEFEKVVAYVEQMEAEDDDEEDFEEVDKN